MSGSALKVWLLRSDGDNKYLGLVGWGGTDLAYLGKYFAGNPMPEDWELPKLEILGKSKRLGDCVGWILETSVVSARARDILEPLVGNDVQFLRFHDLRGKPYFAMNVLRVEKDYLNREQSECMQRRDGEVSVCYRYVFKDDLPETLPSIFKIHPQSSLFVTRKFAEAIVDNKLTGFCLQDPSKDGVRLAVKGLPLNAYPGLL